ncbi:ABC transporter permease [Streptomyces coeruleorubidus]|uniref:ABC transporter permease n=1 Tax=Streptomyces coeruleorubidus TaxID=116188 RepID=UPI0033AC7F7B
MVKGELGQARGGLVIEQLRIVRPDPLPLEEGAQRFGGWSVDHLRDRRDGLLHRLAHPPDGLDLGPGHRVVMPREAGRRTPRIDQHVPGAPASVAGRVGHAEQVVRHTRVPLRGDAHQGRVPRAGPVPRSASSVSRGSTPKPAGLPQEVTFGNPAWFEPRPCMRGAFAPGSANGQHQTVRCPACGPVPVAAACCAARRPARNAHIPHGGACRPDGRGRRHELFGLVILLTIGQHVHDGLGRAVAEAGVLLLFRYTMSWIGTYLGLLLPSERTADSLWPLTLPLSTLSNGFVPTDGMPVWLRAICEWNPVSAAVAACRKLFGNPGVPAADGSWPPPTR